MAKRHKPTSVRDEIRELWQCELELRVQINDLTRIVDQTLKPCPHCNTQPRIDWPRGQLGSRIRCENCNFVGPLRRHAVEHGGETWTPASTAWQIQAWNALPRQQTARSEDTNGSDTG